MIFSKLIHALALSHAHRNFLDQTMDPDIIFVSLKRHSMDFFDKVKRLSLISVYFYTQSAQ